MAILIRPDGSRLDVEIALNDRLGSLQRHVGGLIEECGEYDGLVALADEEGLLKGLEYNPVASCLIGHGVVGPLLLVKVPEEYR